MSRLLAPPSEMMGLDDRGHKIAVGLMVGGGLALIAGAIWYLVRKHGSPLGKATVVSTVNRDGMTLKHYRGNLPIGERVRLLQDLIWESVRDPRNRKLALELTAHCPERDGKCEAKAIGDAGKKYLRYTGDVAPVKMGSDGPVEGVDLYQSAWRTWEFKGGDCDDHQGWVATHLLLNGIPTQLRVTAPDKRSDFSHIYIVAGLPKENPKTWEAVDITLPNYRFGYEVPYGKKQDYPA